MGYQMHLLQENNQYRRYENGTLGIFGLGRNDLHTLMRYVLSAVQDIDIRVLIIQMDVLPAECDDFSSPASGADHSHE